MKIEHPRVVSCMQYAQPAVASVKGYCQKGQGMKTTVDHDRQGQAAHRQYKSRILVEFALGKSMHNQYF